MRVGFHGERLEEAHHRRVEYVHPDYGPSAFVAVIVPIPGGREDQVTRMHRALVAIHGGVGALAIDHEAHGVGAVAMRGRYLAGKQILNAMEMVCVAVSSGTPGLAIRTIRRSASLPGAIKSAMPRTTGSILSHFQSPDWT